MNNETTKKANRARVRKTRKYDMTKRDAKLLGKFMRECGETEGVWWSGAPAQIERLLMDVCDIWNKMDAMKEKAKAK
jgi:hypothetical protein